MNAADPPDPMPRLSPATTTSVVLAGIGGLYENPVPSDDVCVIPDSGIANDFPPGMIPLKLGVLGNFVNDI